ncbi:carbohydrate-binding protein [Roseibacillus persicicus]|uniref:carbohydrate-binding protein n=1 Tax=Roseibacillus persicicus TaxID=454148 RepID=UPI00398A82A1
MPADCQQAHPLSAPFNSLPFANVRGGESTTSQRAIRRSGRHSLLVLLLVFGCTLLFASIAKAEFVQVEAEGFTAQSGLRVETTSDSGGGQNLGYTNTGDWAEYTVDIPVAGDYRFNFRVASDGEGGSIEGVVGSTPLGSATVVDTGGWQAWSTVSGIFTFSSAGTQTIRLNFSGSADAYLFNLNWLSYGPGPILVEAEEFSSMSGIRVQVNSDTDAGEAVAYIDNGDWTEYSVVVPVAGEYIANFRVASDNDLGGRIEMVVDGVPLAEITVPNTNGWQTWITVSIEVNFATAGAKTIRLNYLGGEGALFNVNWFSFEQMVALPLTVGSTLQQKMRYGMDYERLWYWSSNLDGAERDEIARWTAVDADVDFVRVAVNGGYERDFKGDYDLSAYTSKIIPLMQEMKQANPDIKFFASPRPLNESYPSKKWEGEDVRWQPYPFWICGAPTPISGSFDFDWQECAEYLVRYLLLMKSYGFQISFLDITNEWQSNVGGGRVTQDDMDHIHEYLNVTYFQDPWTYSEVDSSILLEPEDIPEIVAPSSWNYLQGTSWINNLDSGDREAISIAASHNTDRDGDAQSFADAVRSRLGSETEIWNTEVHGWKSTSSENETTSFYYYLEAIRAGFGGINGWLAIGTTNQGHSYILSPGGSATRNVKYYIYRKLSSTSNYGHALDILSEPEPGVLNAPLGSNDDAISRNVAAFIKGNLMTVWVINENQVPVSLDISPDGRTIAETSVRRTRWTDPSQVEGFVTFEPVVGGSHFNTLVPGASVCCFEIVLDGEDFSNDMIQGEDFDHSWGLSTQNTGDTGGGLNLQNISNGDFVRYGEVALVEDSLMTFRVARANGRPDGFIEVREGSADGPVLGQVDVPNTNGWQSYETVSTVLDVDAGIYNLYLKFVEDAETTTNAAFVNLNWFTVNELPAPTPVEVSGLTANTVSESEIDLSWEAAAEASSYNLSRALSANGPFSNLSSGIEETSFSDTGLSPYTTYYYRITGNFGEEVGPVSSVVSATTQPAPLSDENLIISDLVLGLDGGGAKQLAFTIESSGLGYDYQLYTSETLLTDDWQELGPPYSGTGTLLEIDVLFDYTDPALGKQFFRLGVSPSSN